VPSLQSMRVKPLRGKALIHRLAFASLGFFTTSLAFADAIHEPLWVENLSPLASLLALPSQRSADIREGLSVTFHSDIATHFVSQARLRAFAKFCSGTLGCRSHLTGRGPSNMVSGRN
jgi:hypothetical protein